MTVLRRLRDALHHRVRRRRSRSRPASWSRAMRHGRELAAVLARRRRARRSAPPAAAPSRTVATSCRNTGLPLAHADHQLGRPRARPSGTGRTRRATARLPDSSSPTGRPRLADCSAARRSATVTPVLARRAGSISTSTARPGPPMRRHLARAGHALQVGLDAVRHALQVEGAGRPASSAEQRQRDDRHVVDALGLDDRVAARPGRAAASRRWS